MGNDGAYVPSSADILALIRHLRNSAGASQSEGCLEVRDVRHLWTPLVGSVDKFIERLCHGDLSRRRAARELDVGYATLKRFIDAGLSAIQAASTDNAGPFALVGPTEPSLTESLNTRS